jgi:hypothetical protein
MGRGIYAQPLLTFTDRFHPLNRWQMHVFVGTFDASILRLYDMDWMVIHLLSKVMRCEIAQ